ncbi:MAG: ArsR/SmtB family transcription factor [Candidatus Thorarchaeota archaeon]|jgi:DNA-binding transcriptional ArsR family regulator
MVDEYIARFKNYEKFCNETPDKAPCEGLYEERRKKIDSFRAAFGSVDSDAFSATIRTGIVFLLLTIEKACVSEIQYALKEPRQPLLSHHLREMKRSGWVTSQRQGRWTCYSLTPEKRKSMTNLLGILVEEK